MALLGYNRETLEAFVESDQQKGQTVVLLLHNHPGG
jgi:hypothetical protein